MIIIEQNFNKKKKRSKKEKKNIHINQLQKQKCKLQKNNKLIQNMPQLRYIHPIYMYTFTYSSINMYVRELLMYV